jgi:transcriptional regulator with XRE-family HTH domain
MGGFMQRNDRLRQHRIHRNWRQRDIADELGITVITIQRWERGTQQPSAYYRIKLCALFGLSTQELGLDEHLPPIALERHVSVGERVEGSSSVEGMLWTVPCARNPHFTGRDDQLSYLEQQFAIEKSEGLTSTRQAGLTQLAMKGPGGIGKTQIAVEYAYRAREQGSYTHIFWINASSEETALTSFAALADLLPICEEIDRGRRAAAAIRWLELCEQRWLLIFDSADDLSFIPAYLPSRGNGSVLFTTRASAVGSLARSFEVDVMGLMEGTQLLLRRAQREPYASASEIDEATNIVMALAHFPLAIDQAGAYIEETRCGLQDYLQLYQKHRRALLARRGKQATGYPASVATTWSRAFQRIAQIDEAAAELLRLCAFLAPDHIPEDLLIKGAPYWPPALQHAVEDRFAFNQMLETLLAFSLVKRVPEHRMLCVCPLVQVIQMEHLEVEQQRVWAERLVRAVNAVFPRDSARQVDIRGRRYLEQVQICDTLIQQHQIQIPEAADLLDRAGSYLCKCALPSLAEPLFLRSLSIQERLAETEHALVAMSFGDIVTTYSLHGEYGQTGTQHQWALCTRKWKGEAEQPEIVPALHKLAVAQNEIREASLTYQQRMVGERLFGVNHAVTT